MESIRSFLKSWPGRIFLMICLSPLVILGLESYFTGGSNTNEVAKVGDQVITRSQYQNALNAQRNELISSGVDSSAINNSALNEEVLKGLIQRSLLQQQAQKIGLHLPDAVINDILLQEPQFLDENGQFSNDRFAFALKQAGMTKDQLFADYRQRLGMSQLYNSIINTALYPSSELNKTMGLQLRTRSVSVHRLPWEAFKDNVSVSDSDIEAYYQQHQQELNSESMVDLAYVVLDPDSIEIEPVTDEEVQAQYEQFKASYQGEYNQKISQILLTDEDATETLATIEKRLKDGDDFAKLAKQYSDDTASRDDGGNIGTFNPEIFGNDSDKVVAAIKDLKVGEVSAPVETSFGYQLFKVTEIEGESMPSLDSMQDELTERAMQQKRESVVADKIMRINELATDGVGIADIAEQETLQVQQIKDFTETNNSTKLNQPAIIAAAFDDLTLQEESVSTNIGLNQQSIWVQPSNYRPVTPLTLEQSSGIIKDILIKEKATEFALAQAKKIANQVNSQGLDSVNIDFTALGEVSRQTQNLTAVEKAVVFSQDTSPNKLVAVPQATDFGASVLVLDTFNEVSLENINDMERLMISINEKENRGYEQFNDYLNYLETATKVERNDAVINEIAGL